MIARVVIDSFRRSLHNPGFSPAILALPLGIALGVPMAIQQAPLLYQLQPGDFATWALAVITIVAATVLAALPSALRAAQLAPATALRME